MTLGLITAIVLANGSVIKAVGMILLGLLLGIVGTDVSSGDIRFAFGIQHLYDGIGFVPLAMGLFGISEIVANLESSERRELISSKIKGLWPSREDFRRSWRAVLRSEEHTSELQSLMRISYAVFCLKKTITNMFTK